MKLAELLEAAVKPIKIKSVSVDKAISVLNEHCKDALWMLEKNRPIWRGFIPAARPSSSFSIVDLSKSERKSQNTSNYYTILLDENPYNRAEGLPKRSKSLICSTDKKYAARYGPLYAAIPFDGVKIGCVNKKDMWDTKVRLFRIQDTIDQYNHFFKMLRIEQSIESFENFAKQVSKSSGTLEKCIGKYWYSAKLAKEEKALIQADFMDYLFKAYSTKKTKHTIATTATLNQEQNQEVWFSDKCVLVEEDTWERIVDAYKVINAPGYKSEFKD